MIMAEVVVETTVRVDARELFFSSFTSKASLYNIRMLIKLYYLSPDFNFAYRNDPVFGTFKNKERTIR